MKLTRLTLTTATFALGLFASVTLGAAEPVRMATEAAFPPFSVTEPDGRFTGFELDLGNAVCERAGFECSWVKQDFDGMIAALLAERFDIAFSAMSITEERRRVADFSIPYFSTATAFFGKPAETPTAADLVGVTVGVVGGSAENDYVTATYPDMKLREYGKPDQIVADLVNGRIQGAYFEQPVGLKLLAPYAGAGYGQIEAVGPDLRGSQGMGAMFRKGDPRREAVNAALREIYADGTFDALVAKYFPEGTELRADKLWNSGS